ncbi:uncharacterized protein J3R85_018014 [Psidium guajava]|nr:uncharacterized protein J3R85_018014 [Psidium guajava]
MPSFRHDQWKHFDAILTLIIPVLVAFIAVKYQGKPNSPFDTHPITIFLSIFSLLLYCSLSLSLVARLPAFRTACGARSFLFLRILSFTLSVASLTSLLFRGLSFLLLYLPLLILLSAAPLHGLLKKLFRLVKLQAVVVFVHFFLHRLRGGRAPPLLPHTVADTHVRIVVRSDFNRVVPPVACLRPFRTACCARTFLFLRILWFSLSIASLTWLLFRGLSFRLLRLPMLILLFPAYLWPLWGLVQKLKRRVQVVALVPFFRHWGRAHLPRTVAGTHFMRVL